MSSRIFLAFLAIVLAAALTSFVSQHNASGAGVAVSIPRFPHDVGERAVRDVAVFYSPDDIDAGSSLETLGYPDGYLFMLHREHPLLKVTVQAVPANRYITNDSARFVVNVTCPDEFPSSVCGPRLWSMIMFNESFDWMELGGHGFYHSPPGDADLDHHEFNPEHDLRALDYGYCIERFKLAREAYGEVGLDNDRLIVMRFPGDTYSDAALRAMKDSGFIAYFTSYRRGDEYACSYLYTNLSDGGRVLDIHGNVPLSRLVGFNAEFIDSCARNGIINFFDHFWESYEPHGGMQPNYCKLNESLNYIESEYGRRVWWPLASELSLWIDFRERGTHNWTLNGSLLEVSSGVPGGWRSSWATLASYTVDLKGKRVKKILFDDGAGWTALGDDGFWIEDGILHLTCPIRNRVNVRVYFTE